MIKSERRIMRSFGMRGKGIINDIIRDYLEIEKIPNGLTEEEYFNEKLNEKLEKLEAEDRKKFGYLWMRYKYSEDTFTNWVKKGRRLELLVLDIAKKLNKLDSKGGWVILDNGMNIGRGADIILKRGNKAIIFECKNFVQSKLTTPIAGEVENRFEESVARLGLGKVKKALILRGKITNPAYALLHRDYNAEVIMLGDYFNIEMLLFYLILVMGITLSTLKGLFCVEFEENAPVRVEVAKIWTKTRLRDLKNGIEDVFEIGRNIFVDIFSRVKDVVYFIGKGGCGRLIGNAEIIFYLITDRKFAGIFLSTIKVG